ncbi:MAG: PSD1 and planctomycete cytochrome C domain-containing protein [Planctomycetota bacterium]|nr:PSD1 and planctomycete cytochrome C domain-containing protein [Planctomycetota bacterium]
MNGPTRYDTVFFLACQFAVLLLSLRSTAEDRIQFNRDIRPILSDRCFQCHGPDEKKREADLRLDLEAEAKRDLGGYRAISTNSPGDSQLLERIFSTDPDEKMPPPHSAKSLSAPEKKLLKQWIEQGAPFEKHWAFQRPRKPKLPSRESSWVRNEIDHFILERLNRHGFSPSPQADRRTLLRRLYLDLVGLLPTPEAVESFVSDLSEDAYEKRVDALLASRHFGERMGRHWLDLARYADSNGYANDGLRSVWPYRDWVISAINEDMPFDRFTIEQLAGDLLPAATESQRIATGFHRNTPHQTEGGSDPEQYRVERTKNRTDTTGAVWLGLTVGCAQCHSHKFDPISHDEYYQLYAFFNNADEPTLSLAPSSTAQREIDSTQTELESIRQKLAETRKQEKQAPADGIPPTWKRIKFSSSISRQGATLNQGPDQVLLASGKNPHRDTYQLEFESDQAVQALRLETFTDPSLPQMGPGRAGNGNFVLAEIEIFNRNQKIGITAASADHAQKGYPVEDAFDGEGKTGWAINVQGGKLNVNRTAFFAFEKPLQGKVTILMKTYEQGNGYNIGKFRVSSSASPPPALNSKVKQLETRLQNLQSDLKRLQKKVVRSLGMSERTQPRETFVQIRGDFLDRGPRVKPATLSVLHPLSPDTQSNERQPNRLDLARWIVSRDNPLTPRVIANRIWQRMFNVGLVETENDFGYQGSLPTHPELLDFLAIDLVKHGWKMKRMYKLIAMSATYRQSSKFRPRLAAQDPRNHWLGRQNRYRVEGEIVRDLALTASGLLSRKMGGPSVFPPIPPNVIGTSSANHRWPESQGEDRYRRGIYTAIYRANVYPMLSVFDGPDRDNACTRRTRSNTPLQALTIANDASFMEMARAFGNRIAKNPQAENTDAGIELACRIALSRPPAPAEKNRLRAYHDRMLQYYLANPSETEKMAGGQAPRRAAWIALARVLLNLDEFITRE